LITFHVKGAETLRSHVDRFPADVDRFTQHIALLVVEKAKELVRVKTGALRRSIDMIRVEPRHYLVRATARHAPWVERGRGPVEAKQAKALRFEVEGRILFRRRVGPARARPFLRPALEWARAQAPDLFRRTVLFTGRR